KFGQLGALAYGGGQVGQHAVAGLEGIFKPVELGVGEPEVGRIGGELFTWVFLPPVDERGNVSCLLRRHTDDVGEDAFEEDAVVGPQDVHVAGGAEGGHHVVDQLEDLDFAV